MNSLIKGILGSVVLLSVTGASARGLYTENVDVRLAGDYLTVSADIVLDSVKLRGNDQLFVTPFVLNDTVDEKELPSVLISGRNIHYSYQRGVMNGFKEIKRHTIDKEVRRTNGVAQTIPYSVRVPMESWMSAPGTRMVIVVDSCGCGRQLGEEIPGEYYLVPPFENPVKEMRSLMIRPPYTEPPVQIHEGKARVQFEVDRTQLHVAPYTCKNGQRIDNRAQIAMIDDSVRYALTDPNVELSAIEICGYASPESPYTHNDELATGRSRALAEYLADHYHLPKERVSYSSVPENWGEFRKMVETSDELTEDQRYDLLQLIDQPAYTPEDYDRKEQILKTDPRFKQLYRSKILPQWFPKLRATTFAIHTRLKPMTDEQLKDVIEKTPEKMSLNQMFAVARMYPEGSDEFNRIIRIALKYYPDDPIAIMNAASAEVAEGHYDKAKEMLLKAGDSPEVYNLLGIIATSEENYDLARSYFEKAGDYAPAQRNLEMLPKERP